MCRQCLNSNTSEIMLLIHSPQCENNEVTAIRTLDEPLLYWKNCLYKNPS